MLHSEDERSWVEQAQDGDPDAIGSLYEEYSDRIYRYALLCMGDPSEAEDVTEQVFLKMMESISTFRWKGKSSFSSWLYRIAHNQVVDLVRQNTRHPHVRLEHLDNVLETDIGDPHHYAEQREFLEQVISCMQELTELQIQVILLKYGAELSNSEVAEVLGRSKDTVAAVQYQALKKLHRLMNLKGFKLS
jgi:RNA polymerase sigma-70 factor (ECF subfamily)